MDAARAEARRSPHDDLGSKIRITMPAGVRCSPFYSQALRGNLIGGGGGGTRIRINIPE